MFYAIYLAGILCCLVKGTGGQFANFIDSITGFYILAPCVLAMLGTRSFRAFGRGFLIAFGKEEDSVSRCEESRQSVWLVMLTSIISGILCFLIGTINSSRYVASEGFLTDNPNWLILDITVAMLSLFYSMLTCLILLPIPFQVKKRLLVLQSMKKEQKKSDDKTPHIQ